MIETEWTMFRNAHHHSGATGAEARNSLVLRYATAIRSYVRAITGSESEADELSQDVIVRLLNGDFAGADPDRGRFRDLLKVAVKNMTRNHWAKENRRKGVERSRSEMDGKLAKEHPRYRLGPTGVVPGFEARKRVVQRPAITYRSSGC